MVTLFAGIIALQLIVAAASIELLSSVRAYVTGESLYSKGQKDAQIHLLDYALYHREEDYLRFLGALAVPLGDRVAREELQKADPDLALARRGFLQGGNHPDDIGGLIRLFRWFHRIPFMAEAIVTWTDGDLVIQQMRSLAEQAHQRVVNGDLDATGAAEMREQAIVLNKRLTQLESKFSAQLGEASRQTQRLLLVVNSVLAALLAVTGLVDSCAAAPACRPRPKTRCGNARNRSSACSTRPPRACSASTPKAAAPSSTRPRCRCSAMATRSELLGREIYELIQPTAARRAARRAGRRLDAARQPRAPGAACRRQPVLAPRRLVVSGRVLVASGGAGRGACTAPSRPSSTSASG